MKSETRILEQARGYTRDLCSSLVFRHFSEGAEDSVSFSANWIRLCTNDGRTNDNSVVEIQFKVGQGRKHSAATHFPSFVYPHLQRAEATPKLPRKTDPQEESVEYTERCRARTIDSNDRCIV